jgi:hypothetical protein
MGVEEEFLHIAAAEGFQIGCRDQVGQQEVELLAELNQTLREALAILTYVDGNTTLNLADLGHSVLQAQVDSELAFYAGHLIESGAALTPREDTGRSSPDEVIGRYIAAVDDGAPEVSVPRVPLYVRLRCSCSIELPNPVPDPFPPAEAMCNMRWPKRQCRKQAIQLGSNDRCGRHLRPGDRRHYDTVMREWGKAQSERLAKFCNYYQHVGVVTAGHWLYRHAERPLEGVEVP